MTKYMSKNTIIKILLTISFISSIGIPCLYHFFPYMHLLYNVLNIFCITILFVYRKQFKINGFFPFIMAYYLILLYSTIHYSGQFRILCSEIESAILTIFIWNSLTREEIKEYISVPVTVLEIFAIINLVLMFLFPQGLYNIGFHRKYYFFDHVNVTVRYLLPGCYFTILRCYLNNKNSRIDNRAIIYFLLVALTLLMTRSVTSLIGFSLFFIGLFLINKIRWLQKCMSPFISTSVFGILSYLIIQLQIQKYFVNFIVHFLHKDLTLTGRMAIWNKTLKVIDSHFMNGVGRLSEPDRVLQIGSNSAHNQYLIFLFEGGIILLLLVFIIMFVLDRKVRKCRDTKIISLNNAIILSYTCMWLTEPFSYSGTLLMFLIWLLIYRSPEIFQKSRNDDCET